jgi:hypothetical protein
MSNKCGFAAKISIEQATLATLRRTKGNASIHTGTAMNHSW